jgi:hypothetical protein
MPTRALSTRPHPNQPSKAGRMTMPPVKATLHRFGVSSPDLLQRAADIGRASAQLIIEAADRTHQPTSGYQHEPPEAEH